MASSDLVVLAMKRQTALGTIATGAYDTMPRINDGLTGANTTVQSQVSTGVNRIGGADIQVGFEAGGEITSEFRKDIFNEVLAGAYASDWDTTDAVEDKLVVGITPIYFTVVKQFPFMSAAKQHYVYQDCVISAVTITLAQGQIISFNFTIQAGKLTRPAVAPWTTLNPAPATDTLVVCKSLLDVRVDGNTVNSVVTNASLTLTNTINALYDARNCDPAEQTLGVAAVSGTFDAYTDDESDDWFVNALTGAGASVGFTVRAEDKTYRFELPAVANNSSAPDTSNDQVTSQYAFSAVNSGNPPEIYMTK